MRRLRIFGCIFSLAVCVALIFFWGRSTQAADDLSYAVGVTEGRFQSTRLWALLSRNGSVGIWTNRSRNARLVKWNGSEWTWQIASRDNSVFPPLDRFGFAFGKVDRSTPGDDDVSYIAMVPYWLLVLLTAIAPVRGLWLLRRRFVRACRGLCLSCGYDLRGTREQCPECGSMTKISGAAPAGRGAGA